LCLVGIGAASGCALVMLGVLVLEVTDLVAAGRVEQPVVWPDRRCLTVWTGEDWFTVTVKPVAFGRWGIAACRGVAHRRPASRELIVPCPDRTGGSGPCSGARRSGAQ
jgi:hypothetical protein